MTTEIVRHQARILFGFGKRMRNQMFRALMQARSSSAGKLHEDLSPPQIHMLLVIRSRQQCTISELAALLDVSAPSVSAMVDRLVEKGALERERSTQDRRVVAVRLSAFAASHIKLIEEAMLENFVGIVEKVGPELAEKWCGLAEEIKTALGEEEK